LAATLDCVATKPFRFNQPAFGGNSTAPHLQGVAADAFFSDLQPGTQVKSETEEPTGA
jgi:hypothetical protein